VKRRLELPQDRFGTGSVKLSGSDTESYYQLWADHLFIETALGFIVLYTEQFKALVQYLKRLFAR
jgi:hypothetical protein